MSDKAIADRLYEAIEAAGPVGLSATEQRDVFARHQKGQTIEAARLALEREGRITSYFVPTEGRPKLVSYAIDSPERAFDDLDGICIRSDLDEIGAKGLAALHGWEVGWDDFDQLMDDDSEANTLRREAAAVVGALITAGVLKREMFSWDESHGCLRVEQRRPIEGVSDG